MYEIHVKGKKKAVLLVLENAVGYTAPEITFEQGDDDTYIVHCEIETKWDADPFGDGESWDGTCVNLDNYSYEGIKKGDYLLCFNGVGTKTLSGMLNVEIEMVNRPDDSYNLSCAFEYYVNGKMVESGQYKNPEFEGEEPEDEDEEFFFEFDEWNGFRF